MPEAYMAQAGTTAGLRNVTTPADGRVRRIRAMVCIARGAYAPGLRGALARSVDGGTMPLARR